MEKEKEIFIKEFVESVSDYMYEHEDYWDFSKGMISLSEYKIKEIAEELFDELFINNKELRSLKLKKLERI